MLNTEPNRKEAKKPAPLQDFTLQGQGQGDKPGEKGQGMGHQAPPGNCMIADHSSFGLGSSRGWGWGWEMQCSFLGLVFLFIVYSHVDIDTDAHNNYTGDTKTKRIHQTLSPKKLWSCIWMQENWGHIGS